jgi:hypothetical protein
MSLLSGIVRSTALLTTGSRANPSLRTILLYGSVTEDIAETIELTFEFLRFLLSDETFGICGARLWIISPDTDSAPTRLDVEALLAIAFAVRRIAVPRAAPIVPGISNNCFPQVEKRESVNRPPY